MPQHVYDTPMPSQGNYYDRKLVESFQRRDDYKSKLEQFYDPNDIGNSYKRMQKEINRVEWHHKRRQNIIKHSNDTKRTVFDYGGYILPQDTQYFIEEFPEIYNPKPKDEGFNFEDRLGIPTSQRKSSNELQEIKSTVNELKTSIDEIKEHTEKTANNSKNNNQQSSESEQSTNNEQSKKQIEVQKSVLQQDKSQKHNDNESLKSLTDDLIVNKKLNK